MQWACKDMFVSVCFSEFRVLSKVITVPPHGDIEVNPGPKRKTSKFSCCHWNVNSILAHDKLSLIKPIQYNTVQKYDIICISKTFLDLPANENSLLIAGSHLLRAVHPNNLKKGNVCLYFKGNLSLRHQIKTPYCSQCILCELTIQKKKVIVIHCFPSQSLTYSS